MHPPRIWLLTGPRAGELAQQRQLAGVLGEPYLEKPVFKPEAARQRGFGWTPADAAACGLVAPWPALVISFGKTLPAALWVREASGGQARIVHLGRPRGVPAAAIDLILPMPQDAMAEAPNVLRLRMPLNVPPRPCSATLSAARTRLEHLPRPWTALVIGGSSAHFTLDQQTLAETLSRLDQDLAERGGSLLVSTSPRTPQWLLAPLAARLAASGRPYECNVFSAGAKHNAYAEYLALADDLVVTGDTASMIADGWRSGRPVRVVSLPPTQRLRWRRALLQHLPEPLVKAMVARGWWSPTVDLDQWIAALAAEGRVGIFGTSSARQLWRASADDDLQIVQQRLLQMLKQGD